MTPLLARAFGELTPEEFHVHVRSLYVAPPVRLPPAEVAVRLNEKGNPVITVRRNPKVITRAEAEQLALDAGLSLQAMWLALSARKIQITVPRKESRRARHSRS